MPKWLNKITAPTLAALMFGFALVPLPQLNGNPTGLKFLLDMWHLEKTSELVKFNIALSDNAKTRDEIESKKQSLEFYYNIHKSTKPRKHEFESMDEFLHELENWEEEKKSKEQAIEDERNKYLDNSTARLRIIAENPAIPAAFIDS